MPLLTLLFACATDPAPDEDAHDYAFESAERCGACHPGQYAEWRQSMHAYGAISPVFDAMASRQFEHSEGEIDTFCTKCHAPIGAANGEGGDTTADTRSAISREGVSCDYCHVAVDIDGPVANNSLARGNGGTKYGSITEPQDSPAHYARRGDLVTSSELCGACHDVVIDEKTPVEVTYTEYLESPAGAEGVRCQDCHMGPVPGVVSERPWGPAAIVDGVAGPDRELSDHRFIGPDTPVIDGFPYPDDLDASAAAQAEHRLEVEALLRRSVEISAAHVESTSSGVELSVTLQSLTRGHRVPTGFTAERQLWLEVQASDADGGVVYRSGDLDDDGNLRDLHSSAVQRGEALLDAELANLQATAQVWVDGALQPDAGVFAFDADHIRQNGLDPGESRTFDYALPEQTQTVHIALRYRSMPPYVLQALDLEALTERLPVFELDAELLAIQPPPDTD